MRELAATGEPLVATHLSQPAPHAVGEQPTNVVHVHVGKHHVGHGCEIDAGGLQSEANRTTVASYPPDSNPGPMTRSALVVLHQCSRELSYEWLHEECAARRHNVHLHAKRLKL